MNLKESYIIILVVIAMITLVIIVVFIFNIIQKNKLKNVVLHKNTITKLLRTGEGTKSVKELARLWLKIEKEEFYSLLNN